MPSEAHQQVGAVGGCLGHHIGGQIATRTRAVLHNHLPAQQPAQFGCNFAGDGVGAAARSRAHPQARGGQGLCMHPAQTRAQVAQATETGSRYGLEDGSAFDAHAGTSSDRITPCSIRDWTSCSL